MTNPSNLFLEIESLSSAGTGKGFKPHKLVLVLAVTRLYKSNKISIPVVALTDTLKNEFALLLAQYGGIEDKNRPWAPFYHLKSTSFWRLIPMQGKEELLGSTPTVGSIGDLNEIVKHAELSTELTEVLKSREHCERLEKHIINCIEKGLAARHEAKANSITPLPRILFQLLPGAASNPFVGYLNSLSQVNASNNNSLAEYQACNPFFAHIHVQHPLTSRILSELKNPKGAQVILTGHAGDGKSSIALEVYKTLNDISPDKALLKPLSEREDIPGTEITIIKDLSEREKKSDSTLIQNLLSGHRRYLIVSNTGTLLDLFRSHASSFDKSQIQIEADVLDAISFETGSKELLLKGRRFLLVNLAMIDNLDMARAIFEKMIAKERWATCEGLPCHETCPIYINVDLINSRKSTVVDRIFLAYRRMYEYGTRLTMRQITGHLAYILTSGLAESDISEMRDKQENPLKAKFMFFNRFFGDDGISPDDAARTVQAITEIHKQGFGERPAPTWERKLWLAVRERDFDIGIEGCEEEFELLRQIGAGVRDDDSLDRAQARTQVRRMLYFLYDFSSASLDNKYLESFLNSPNITCWMKWQKSGAKLDITEKIKLRQYIYHVLQEQFSGIRLPEGTKRHDRLYITLNQGNAQIRQSAQVVLAQIDWENNIELTLDSVSNALGLLRTDLVLKGTGHLSKALLQLRLPFLDYVSMRHFGEVAGVLQPAYMERLERFKSRLRELSDSRQSEVMLVRLKTDHTFRRQQYLVADGKLEANDVD